MPKFQTAVSEVTPGTVNIRGHSQADIMEQLSYAEASFLTIIGRLPAPGERRVTEVILNSLLDHGWVASTITAARYVASGNPQLVPAVAGGLLAAGSNTLSPQHAFEFVSSALELQEDRSWDIEKTAKYVVAEARAARRRIPGFGHPVHREGDFRADIVFRVAQDVGSAGPATQMYHAIHAAFVDATGRIDVPINIDGCLACVGRDMGWTASQVVAFALLAVMPGLIAHAIEEIEQAVPLRHIEGGQYTGEAVRPLPARAP